MDFLVGIGRDFSSYAKRFETPVTFLLYLRICI